jgi:hypothetical protein
MTFNYAGTQQSAYNLLSKFGQAITIVRTINESYDPVTSAVTATTTTQAARGVTLNYNSKDVDGVLILRGDQQLFLSPVGIIAPAIGDKVTINSVDWMVTMVDELNPGGTALLLICNLRK